MIWVVLGVLTGLYVVVSIAYGVWWHFWVERHQRELIIRRFGEPQYTDAKEVLETIARQGNGTGRDP